MNITSMKESKKNKAQIELMAGIVQSNIMDEIDGLLDELGKNRNYLAKEMSLSNSFISQLFSIDKPLNLKHIGQFEKIFNKRLRIEFGEIKKRKILYPFKIEQIGKYETVGAGSVKGDFKKFNIDTDTMPPHERVTA